MKIEKLGEEVSDKIKSAVRAKLTELGIHIDNELPDYVMVLVANKKTQQQMEDDLKLFLGNSTASFTKWLYEILKKLERFTITSKGTKRKVEDKKSKHKKSLSDEHTTTNKKVKVKNENSQVKLAENYFDSEEVSNSNEGFQSFTEIFPLPSRIDETIGTEQRSKLATYTDEELLTGGDDDDAIQLHDNNEGGCIPDRPSSSPDDNFTSSTKLLESYGDKIYNVKSKEDSNRPRERIKISWDSLNDKVDNKKKPESKSRNRSRERVESNGKMCTSVDNNIKSSMISDNERSLSAGREKSEYFGNRIADARDILKKRSTLSSKMSRGEGKIEKNRHSRRDRGSKENHSRFLSSVSKPVKRDTEKPTVPSLVKVTPRPIRPPGMQPSCNLILKAVADAEKSITTSKITQKKIRAESVEKENVEKEKKPVKHGSSRRENISITLLNDRVISSDIEDADTNNRRKTVEEFKPTYPIQNIQISATLTDTIDNKTESINSTNINDTNGLQHSFSKEELRPFAVEEPRFIITLDSTASDTEIEGELELTLDDEISEKSCNEETLAVVRQPFDKSRLGPRLGPPVNDEQREYRLYTINEGNDSSQDIEMDTTEALSENGKSQTRCKYWPCCDAGNTCPYYHPTMLCRLFPACHFGDKCLYIHPACKFADKCMNITCPYAHTSATPVVGKGSFKTPLPLSVPNSQVCMYFPHCTKPFCPYLHVKKPCKFGSSCAKVSCEFEHPNRTLTKNPYKYIFIKSLKARGTLGHKKNNNYIFTKN